MFILPSSLTSYTTQPARTRQNYFQRSITLAVQPRQHSLLRWQTNGEVVRRQVAFDTHQ
ncbi:MAG: hypothetical protein ACRC8A_05040 [Microcoleaceae cyanobacterium]